MLIYAGVSLFILVTLIYHLYDKGICKALVLSTPFILLSSHVWHIIWKEGFLCGDLYWTECTPSFGDIIDSYEISVLLEVVILVAWYLWAVKPEDLTLVLCILEIIAALLLLMPRDVLDAYVHVFNICSAVSCACRLGLLIQ
jgi:hypothetical protein